MVTDYDNFGGKKFFTSLVKDFYQEIINDPILKPMYPEDDLGPAAERLRMFLEQYWGGPQTYQETRGHPRLKQRHQPFKINPLARERWLHHMKVACDSLELAPLHQAQLWGYLDRAATSMLNTFDD